FRAQPLHPHLDRVWLRRQPARRRAGGDHLPGPPEGPGRGPALATAQDPAGLRAAARRGEWEGSTAGHCPHHQQANLVVLPADWAAEFASFCTRNPKPCPLLEITAPGDPVPRLSAANADLRTDVPSYRVYREGELAERRADISDLWRPDLVAFLLGCSFTFEHALAEAGIRLRHVERGTTVPMFVSGLRCIPAGRFQGPMVVAMRALARESLSRVLELS